MTDPSVNPLKQPPALTILFLTEMWERYGFYIVQGLLVLYLTKVLNMSDSASYAITGAFTAFVYISPIIGGYIADKILGFKTAILVGNSLFILGYGLLSLLNPATFYIALALVILGNGFFKPSIASLLGVLYDKNDPRRESGFTLFYMGINLGSMFATLSAGFVKEWLGWGAGFSLACFGLLAGLIIFLFGLKKLKGQGLPPRLPKSGNFVDIFTNKTAVIIGSIISIPLLTMLLKNKTWADFCLIAAAVGLIIGITVLAFYQKDRQARNNIIVLLILNIFAVVYWALFFQIFFSVNLFIDRSVDRNFFGFGQIPTIVFMSFEAFFIIVTGPFLARLWLKLSYKKKNPPIPAKVLIGFLLASLAFFILAAGAYFHNSQGYSNLLWIPLGYLFITLGEMLISPITLSAVTSLSPPQWRGMMMGVYLIAIGYGGKVGGMLANFSSIPENITSILVESTYYQRAFLMFAVLALLVALVIFILQPFLKRLIGTSATVK